MVLAFSARVVASTLLALQLSSSQHPITNAPVAPDAIYLGRLARDGGLSIVDLNGFGGGTGAPTFDPGLPIVEGNSNFPNNPNVNLMGALLSPPLDAGDSTLDGGSAGVFTLARDSALDDVLRRGLRVADLMLGHPLDLVANNGFCNPCSRVQFQAFGFAPPHALVPDRVNPIHTAPANGNPISWAPHPNPPPLSDAGGCPFAIAALEPTSILTGTFAVAGLGLPNLLAPGTNFLGTPEIQRPPTNLLARQQNAFFVGPGPIAPIITACEPNMIRQQVGHFLYVIDRATRSVRVLNSNRMTELARIPMDDPVELAMSPDLDLLAVTSRSGGRVDFIDIDPRSTAFHQIVHSTRVGLQPLGIAWDPGAEDVLVCNEGDGSVSILSARTLEVRKTVSGLARPFALAVTPRQDRFGLFRNVYFAYILQRNGRVAVFESGPSGPGGWGFDEVVAVTDFAFRRPRAIQPDHRQLSSGVWIAHEEPLGTDGRPTGQLGGALSNLVLDGASGQITLLPGEIPHLRALELKVARSIGEGPLGLSGVPLDVAFDDQSNLGALANYHTPFSAGAPALTNGKNLVREVRGAGILATNEPAFVFVPTRPGVVDVIELESGQRVDTNPFHAGVQSIPAADVRRAMDYFRQ